MRIIYLIPAVVIMFAACGPKVDLEVNAPGGARMATIVPEAYLSAWTRPDNIDSPAFWHGPMGRNWIVTTAKESDFLVIYDAVTGDEVKRVGGPGTAAGQLARPNGVVVIGNLALVVERDNHRVQVFGLPDFSSMEIIGQDDLRRPYGLYVYQNDESTFRLYVTDDYETANGEVPPADQLGERVKMFEFLLVGGHVPWHLVKSFGQTSGGGVLDVVESVWGDPEHDVLLLADEQDNVMEVYDLDGNYQGRSIGRSLFKFQTEGIVLVDCGDGDGWWLASDQGDVRTVFHVFDRRSFDYAGSFAGNEVANTDGIAVTQRAFGPFQGGAFVAVHDDGGIGTFDLREIGDSLGIELDCNIME